MLVGRVNLGGFSQACPASYSTEDAMAKSIVRLECEAEELRATVAMLQEQARILADERDEARDMVNRLRKQRAIARNFGEQMERERDEARLQYRSTEALGMALVKTIDQLKEEKADLVVKLNNLQGGQNE